jgi:hypothetical protein
MGLDKIGVIDAIGTDLQTNVVILSIIDSWDWRDERKHLLALQAKFNAYFEFVESGQIYEEYPDANGRSLHIDIIARFPMSAVALSLVEKAAQVAVRLNVTVGHWQR